MALNKGVSKTVASVKITVSYSKLASQVAFKLSKTGRHNQSRVLTLSADSADDGKPHP